MSTDPRLNIWDTASNREAESDGNVEQSVSPELTAEGDIDWLATARHASQTALSFINANLRFRWSRSYRAFQNRHNDSSKYNSDRYRGRSSLFRPKTRAAVRRADANVGAAFFATHDVVNISAENDADPMQEAGASLQHEIMNLRLDRSNTDFGLPNWFLTVIGAHQDAKITGICTTKQSWKYAEDVIDYTEQEYVDEETGELMIETVPITRKRVSRPDVELFPPENVLRDPAAHWIDQAQTGSFLILRYPMTAGDIKARMGADNPIGAAWNVLDESQLNRSIIGQDDSAVRRAREGKGVDRLDENYTTIQDHEMVWVHENFIRMRGQDMHFWSVGSHAYLTYPTPVIEVYPEQNGRRPIIIGYGQVEAHKVDPMSMVESWQPLQSEANDIVNLRLDNVKQSISPVTKVRRGRNVDIAQVQRRSADSVIWLSDLKDIEWDRVPDVSSSSYAEMDRINADLDDLSGTFSTGSVTTQRQMSETVGGMNLLNAASNSLGEFDIRVLNETWMEPVLRQLANLTSYYEHDERILTVAGSKAGLWQQYVEGLYDIDGLLTANINLRVDAGTSATDPMQRLQKIRMGAETVQVILGPEVSMQKVNPQAVIEEVFGVLGYKDGMRFYDLEGPSPQEQMMGQQLQMAMAEIENLQRQLEDGQADREKDILVARIKSATDLVKEMLETARQQYQAQIQQQSQILTHHAATSATRQRRDQARLQSDNQRSAQEQKAKEAARRPAMV